MNEPTTAMSLMLGIEPAELVFQGPDASWSDPGKKFYVVNRGRACLDCGYVIVQLSAGALTALRLEVETLTTVPEKD